MNHGFNDRLEMNIMWAVMGLMFIFEVGMFYFHVAMHKRLKKSRNASPTISSRVHSHA